MTAAYDFLMKEKMGMMTEDEYGVYKNKQERCKYNAKKAKVFVKSYKLLS